MRTAIELLARWAAMLLLALFVESMLTFGELYAVHPADWHWAAWIAQSCIVFLTFYGAMRWTEDDAKRLVD